MLVLLVKLLDFPVGDAAGQVGYFPGKIFLDNRLTAGLLQKLSGEYNLLAADVTHDCIISQHPDHGQFSPGLPGYLPFFNGIETPVQFPQVTKFYDYLIVTRSGNDRITSQSGPEPGKLTSAEHGPRSSF